MLLTGQFSCGSFPQNKIVVVMAGMRRKPLKFSYTNPTLNITEITNLFGMNQVHAGEFCGVCGSIKY